MPVVRAVGLDWATEPKNRAAVVLDWAGPGYSIRLHTVIPWISDDRVVQLCTGRDTHVVAVDVPFGWPRAFSEFVCGWSPQGVGAREVPSSRDFRYRATDRIVQDELGKNPLSVSADRIGISSRAWAELLGKHGLGSRIDTGVEEPEPEPDPDAEPKAEREKPAIIEIYPGATLRAIFPKDHPVNTLGYRQDADARQRVLLSLLEHFHITATAAHMVQLQGKAADTADALIAALTGLMYLQPVEGWSVRRPTTEQQDDAAKEGWVFFPQRAAPEA